MPKGVADMWATVGSLPCSVDCVACPSGLPGPTEDFPATPVFVILSLCFILLQASPANMLHISVFILFTQPHCLVSPVTWGGSRASR